MIRDARPSDLPAIAGLIRELAEYERLSHAVAFDEASLGEHLFGPQPAAEVLVAEAEQTVVGFALFFGNFSTFQGRPGIYLEDLFVQPAFRGRGLGKALFLEVARRAVARGCGRFEWSVLDWNRPAIEFYECFGAEPLGDWTVYRLSGEALRRTAEMKA